MNREEKTKVGLSKVKSIVVPELKTKPINSIKIKNGIVEIKPFLQNPQLTQSYSLPKELSSVSFIREGG